MRSKNLDMVYRIMTGREILWKHRKQEVYQQTGGRALGDKRLGKQPAIESWVITLESEKVFILF